MNWSRLWSIGILGALTFYDDELIDQIRILGICYLLWCLSELLMRSITVNSIASVTIQVMMPSIRKIRVFRRTISAI